MELETLNKNLSLFPQEKINNIIKKISFTSFRATKALSEYLKDFNDLELSIRLGHTHFRPELLKSYLPESLNNYFRSRSIKTTQTLIVAQAMKGHELILTATNFPSLSKLQDFLKTNNHQNRTEGLNFKVGGFTNITHDHLDYHKTFEEYLKVKKRFFDELPSEAVAITNADDKNGAVMLQNTKAKKKTYALKTMADYHGKILEVDFNGMLLNFNGKEFWTTLTGKFNGYNLLLAYAVAVECGCNEEEVLQAISTLHRVKGRFETLKSAGGIFFVVDYAHTPDALENILDSINEIRTKNERLITVFGCGGDRDHEKRPEMGRIATRKSTLAIITTDNPRTEDPSVIIKEIEAGVEPQNFGKYTSIPDRKEAIKMAIKFAEPKDIILVAGKGHETYQEINGVRHHFDDKETIMELTQLMSK